MDDLLRRWNACEHDQFPENPHYYLCQNGCGAWVEYIPETDDREDPDIAFELRWYPIEEEPG